MEIAPVSQFHVGPSSRTAPDFSDPKVKAGFEEVLLQILLKDVPLLPKLSSDRQVEGLLEGVVKSGLAHAWAQDGVFAGPLDRQLKRGG